MRFGFFQKIMQIYGLFLNQKGFSEKLFLFDYIMLNYLVFLGKSRENAIKLLYLRSV